jgi:CheY-like chemotaxis protein/HPt (histidine-containing phosphotransfer) domain-containing protein
MQADPRLAGIRLVMLTSLGTRGDANRFMAMGFAAYLNKPVRHQELQGVLSLALGGPDSSEPRSRRLITRHTARETLNLFAGRKARILLAEDNITNQQVALGILRKLGLRADAVANGEETLKALETLPYDLVLMDVQMPVMDGLEATRQIRHHPRSTLSAIPIIAMTAHALQGDRERCLAAGMNDYVTKPVTPQALAETLEQWLPEEIPSNPPLAKGGDEYLQSIQSPPLAKGGEGGFEHPEPPPTLWDRAGMLERLMGDEELARAVTDGFLEDLPRQIAALRGYLKTDDAAAAERQAHTIKGASANVGGERLRVVAFAMEKAARSGDLRAAGESMAELEMQFDQLKELMENRDL